MFLTNGAPQHGAMMMGRAPLGRILTRKGVITEVQLEQALHHQLDRGGRVGEALVSLGFCSDVEVARALAEQIEATFVDLIRTPPDPELISLIPRDVAMEHAVLPVAREHGRLLVVAHNASDIRIDEVIRQCTGMPIRIGVAPESQLFDQLQRHYGLQRTHPGADLTPMEAGSGDLEVVEEHDVSIESLMAAGDDISAAQIISTIVSDAVRKSASDIHLEPQEHVVRVRYRIDGEMLMMLSFDRRLLPSVAARLKVMCAMDLAESRRPQDGSCRVRVDNQVVELRASTLPGVFGEIMVMRVLARDTSLQKIDALGLAPDMQQEFRRLLAANSGMILVTGPTGSGKTTTLYAGLDHVNQDNVNVITVEDPVELRIPSINQVQVDDRAGRSFATTLRAMLRQDPDIIMVGEIRDTETVEIACRAALTGHLVLSTLHTRHAFGTLSRLHDMGVSRYTVAASVNGILAQRLLRRICEECSAPYQAPDGVVQFLEAEFGSVAGMQFRKGMGCDNCRGSGMRGRVGVYELLSLDSHLRRLIAEDQEPSVLRQYADSRGFRTLEQDAFRKACQGLVTPEEVLKLCAWITPEE